MPSAEYTQRRQPRKGTKVVEGVVVGRGENKKVVDPKEVEKLAKLWCSIDEMSDFFGVARETFAYNFKDIIVKARSETKQRLRQTQLKVALEGNVTMLIWLGKNILGQMESPELFVAQPELTQEQIDDRISKLLQINNDKSTTEHNEPSGQAGTNDAATTEGIQAQTQ